MSPAGFDDHRHTVALPSADLSYIAVGEGPPALFVHGIATNAHVWEHLIFGLADTRRCIAVDLPLHGRSPARPGQHMTLRAFADVLAEFCEHIAPTTVDLVGHDTGGAIAQLLAARRPELLRTLTLTNCETQDNMPPAAMADTVKLARSGQLVSAAPAILADPDASRAFFATGYENPGFLSAEQIRDFLEPVIGTPAAAERFQELIAQLNPADLLAAEPGLRDLNVPALIVWGTDDEFFPIKWAYWLAGTIPSSREVIELPGAKLFFPHERADQLATHIRHHWTQAHVALPLEIDLKRRDLIDELSDALDEYWAAGTDLSTLVHDADPVISELAALYEALDDYTASATELVPSVGGANCASIEPSAPPHSSRIGELRQHAKRLKELQHELQVAGVQELSEPQLGRASEVIDQLRRALDEASLSTSSRLQDA